MEFTPGNVYTLKLNSGEELVARVVEQQNNVVEIDMPLSVAPGPQGMGLVPGLFTADQDSKVTININSISMSAPTNSTIEAKYLEATTGLTVPDKKIIMG
jgi:hypothetical protein